MKTLLEKYEVLKEYLKELGSVAVAFSGGVDSTFLLKVAHDVLGDKAIAVNAYSDFIPDREYNEAVDFCGTENIKLSVLEIDILSHKAVAANPPDRCYLCKKAIFSHILEEADKHGISYVVEGSNMDDKGDYRPGMIAIRELGIKSPLTHAQLTKAEIRQLSEMLKLPTWSKPSFACLASRFVYGETITAEKLAMVDKAEQLLMDKGFVQFRVRIHGDLARIEVLPEDFDKIMQPQLRAEIDESLKAFGFSYVALDMRGYRTGSMNEVLKI